MLDRLIAGDVTILELCSWMRIYVALSNDDVPSSRRCAILVQYTIICTQLSCRLSISLYIFGKRQGAISMDILLHEFRHSLKEMLLHNQIQIRGPSYINNTTRYHNCDMTKGTIQYKTHIQWKTTPSWNSKYQRKHIIGCLNHCPNGMASSLQWVRRWVGIELLVGFGVRTEQL